MRLRQPCLALLLASSARCGAFVAVSHASRCGLVSLTHCTRHKSGIGIGNTITPAGSRLASHIRLQAELEPDEQPAADEPIDEPMQPMDYARFIGTIAGFMVFFYVVAGVFSAAAVESPLDIAAKVDADWTNAHGTAELSRLYTPNALVIKSTADRFEPAAVFAAAESTLKAQPDVTLTPISAERDGSVVHHIFRTCTAGGSCGNGYFRLEQQARGAWKIATDVWTLTPYK